MIPFAALACLIETKSGEILEASLADISALGFTLRTPHAWRGAIAGAHALTLRYHSFAGDAECMLTADTYALSLEEDTPEWLLWRVEIDDAAFRTLARRFMTDFSTYTELKLAGDDAKLSEALTGYPAASETVTGETFAAQRAAWLAPLEANESWRSALAEAKQLALSLSAPPLWEQYLRLPMDAFAAWYWRTHALAHHALAQRRPDCLYIGSSFCPLLFPDGGTLTRLLDKAQNEHIVPVVVLAPVSEGRMDAADALLTRLAALPAPPELVVNDWGTAQLAHAHGLPAITLGVLLNKRRRDARMQWMQGFGGRDDLLAPNALNAPFFREWLLEQGFTRLSSEACGMPLAPLPGPLSLHLPFYQMNTALRCPLAARCETGDRALQGVRNACPRWCGRTAFLYPDALRMAGRYNSLFGLDSRSLTDGEYLRGLPGSADRLVIDLL